MLANIYHAIQLVSMYASSNWCKFYLCVSYLPRSCYAMCYTM